MSGKAWRMLPEFRASIPMLMICAWMLAPTVLAKAVEGRARALRTTTGGDLLLVVRDPARRAFT